MKKLILGAFTLALDFTSCKEKPKEDDTSMTAEQTMETPSQEGEWVTLFDGTNLDAFKAYNKDTLSSQWSIKGDALVFTPAEGRHGSENLITKDEYHNFVIDFDWMISQGGNSGFMWAVKEDPKLGEPYLTGPEIQILDDKGHPDAKAGRTHQSGALYDMIAASEMANPAGEWNHYEITINYDANQGVINMNGDDVVTFPLSGEGWTKLVENSKFKNWSDFAKSDTGHLAFQDHGHEVSFKNIKIKELK